MELLKGSQMRFFGCTCFLIGGLHYSTRTGIYRDYPKERIRLSKASQVVAAATAALAAALGVDAAAVVVQVGAQSQVLCLQLKRGHP